MLYLDYEKTVAESATILSEVMMPQRANYYGGVHGGTILKLVDEVAFVATTKHARKNVVVASIDCVEFRHPVNVGDLLRSNSLEIVPLLRSKALAISVILLPIARRYAILSLSSLERCL